MCSNSVFIFANRQWKWISLQESQHCKIPSTWHWVVERGICVWVYGWIDDTQVAFYILKKLDWSITMWEKRWSTKNVDHGKNINTVWAVIDDDRHLSTRALEALLHIPQMIIHCILTEKMEMVHVALIWVLHIVTNDQIQIRDESASKFLGLIQKIRLTWTEWWRAMRRGCITKTHSLSERVSTEKRKMNQGEKVRLQKSVDKIRLIVFFDHRCPPFL